MREREEVQALLSIEDWLKRERQMSIDRQSSALAEKQEN